MNKIDKSVYDWNREHKVGYAPQTFWPRRLTWGWIILLLVVIPPVGLGIIMYKIALRLLKEKEK